MLIKIWLFDKEETNREGRKEREGRRKIYPDVAKFKYEIEKSKIPHS